MVLYLLFCLELFWVAFYLLSCGSGVEEGCIASRLRSSAKKNASPIYLALTKIASTQTASTQTDPAPPTGFPQNAVESIADRLRSSDELVYLAVGQSATAAKSTCPWYCHFCSMNRA